ncbi:hypothetical protein [Herbidospora galbida]|uniref:hypothetical protein n=1 Tax=Herbidospora galbida TaxID=2575442 RepID=UPI001BB0BADD|nr:hypothetical protein [Herbidospora galbida]
MTTAVAATIRERARAARQALRAAHRSGDAHAVLVAEEEWEDLRRLARAHSVVLPEDDGGEDEGVKA